MQLCHPALVWLAALAAEPQAMHAYWCEKPAAELPLLGRAVEVVQAPVGVGLDAVARLREHGAELGPVLLATRLTGEQVVQVMLPSGSRVLWDSCQPDLAEVRRDARGRLLPLMEAVVVPGPVRAVEPTVEWVVPPDGSGRLTDPHALAGALTAAYEAHRAVHRAETVDATRAMRAWVATQAPLP